MTKKDNQKVYNVENNKDKDVNRTKEFDNFVTPFFFFFFFSETLCDTLSCLGKFIGFGVLSLISGSFESSISGCVVKSISLTDDGDGDDDPFNPPICCTCFATLAGVVEKLFDFDFDCESFLDNSGEELIISTDFINLLNGPPFGHQYIRHIHWMKTIVCIPVHIKQVGIIK